MHTLFGIFWAILAISAVFSLMSISEKLREIKEEAHVRTLLMKALVEVLRGKEV